MMGYKADTGWDLPYIPLKIHKAKIKPRRRKITAEWKVVEEKMETLYSEELFEDIQLALIAEQEFFTEEEFNL